MTRRFFLWLLATVLFCLFCLALSPSVLFLSVIALITIGSVSLSGGVFLAAYADQQISWQTLLQPSAVVSGWRYLFRTFPNVIRHNPTAIVFALLGNVVTFMIVRNGTSLVPSSSSTSLLVLSLLVVFYLGFGSLAVQNLLMNHYPDTHIHRLLATILLGLSWDESESLVLRGYLLNTGVLIPLSSGPYVLASTSVILLVALIPVIGTFVVAMGFVLLPLVSCFCYVSFRDIYLGVAENAPVKSIQQVAAPASSSGLQNS